MNRKALMVLLALLTAMTACGDASDSQMGENNNPLSDTQPFEESQAILRENTPDNLPDDLNFNNETVTVFYRDSRINDLIGFEEKFGEVVNDALYQRNRAVEERLNVKLEYISGSDAVKNFSNAIRSSVNADDDDFDIIYHVSYHQAILGFEGLLTNLIDAPYLDYDQPWWSTEFMDTIAVHPDYRYQLVGDYTTERIAKASATFVNKRMLTENFGSVDDFYQMILDGGWTFDKMREYCAEVYQDLNLDGKTDYDDILGSATSWASQIEHFTFSAEAKYTERDEEGFPQLLTDQSKNVEIAEKLYELIFETEGFHYDADYNSVSNKQLEVFKNGTMLFYSHFLNTTDSLRDMNDSYGIIPRPKLDESQENYRSLVHDTMNTFSIPNTNDDLEMTCAVIEAMAAEGYRKVIPAYYEEALKVKYAQDDVSVKMIDIISDNSTTDFIYVNNYVFDDAGSLGTISRVLIQEESSNYMSTYAEMQTALETLFETVFTEFKSNAR